MNHIEPAEKKAVYPLIIQQTNKPTSSVQIAKTLQLIDKMLASVAVYTLGCNRRRETRCAIMKNRGSWCRRKVRKTGITITAMRRSAPFILSVPFVDWDVRWRI